MPWEAPTCLCGTCRKCRNRARQRLYGKTDKGKAATKRYRHTAKGRVVVAKTNAVRVYVGKQYHGRAQTAELAAVVNAHVKERLHAFKRQQKRAEVEALEADTVSL